MSRTIPAFNEEDLAERRLSDCINECAQTERAISRVLIEAQEPQTKDLSRFEVEESIFRNCILVKCDFAKSSFNRVFFIGCDFSNSKFSEAYFKQCVFRDCKGMGMEAPQLVAKQTVFENCDLRYAVFNQAKMNDITFDKTDLTDAIITETELKNVEMHESKLVNVDFFKTPLKDIDVSKCEFRAPLVSSPPTELQGLKVNMFQAASLIGLIGVTVVE